MSIYWPRNATSDAREIPELRKALIDFATDDGVWARTEHLRVLSEFTGVGGGFSFSNREIDYRDDGTVVIQGPKGYTPDQLMPAINGAMMRSQHTMAWFRRSLREAQLMHVTSEMCEVLFSSLNSIPDDRVLEHTDPPTPSGFVVFEQPWVGIDSGDEFEQVRVDGVLWSTVFLPPRDETHSIGDPSDEAGHPGFSICAFRYADPLHHDDLAMESERQTARDNDVNPDLLQPMWMPLGRADWIIGDRIDRPTHDMIDPDSKSHRSMMEDRKLMAALWALVAQKRIVDRSIALPSRAAAKRLDRAGDTTQRAVQIIHLRRPEYRPTHADGSTGRKIGVRYAVRPFWRNQAYGPNWSKHRLILVPAHMRGPEGAPLRNVERVWEVDR